MKKMLLFLITFIAVISLISCTPKDDPQAKIIKQYDEFIANDILDEAYFDEFINSVSNFIIPGVVVIKVVARDAQNQVVKITEGTGFIYAIYENSLRVVTSLDVVRVDDSSWTIDVQISDFANRIYSGLVINESSVYNLARIKFDTNVAIAKIRKINLSPYVPIDQEPILMLSNYQLSRNSLVMGFLSAKDEVTGLYMTTLPTDEYTLGGTVINMRKEVIGIVVGFNEGEAQILGIEALREYLNL